MANTKCEVSIIGRLGRDAEVKTLSSGKIFLSFTIATDVYDSETKSEVAMWHSCALWTPRDGDTRRIDALAPYMTKGKQVSVDGSLKYNNYTNKDGVEVQAININAREIVLLGSKDDNAEVTPIRQDMPSHGEDIPF